MWVVDGFRNNADHYTLHIEMEPVFSRQVASKLLPKFLAQHPKLFVGQMLTTNHFDFLPQTELAIKWGDGDWEGFDSQFLCSLDYVPVCWPEYLKRKPLTVTADLADAETAAQQARSNITPMTRGVALVESDWL